MPVLIIYGVPGKTPKKKLKQITTECKKVVACIPELRLSENDVTVFFPSDLLQTGLGEEIIVFIDGLFKKPERNADVIHRLVGSVGTTLKERHFPDALVECFVRQIRLTRAWASRQ